MLGLAAWKSEAQISDLDKQTCRNRFASFLLILGTLYHGYILTKILTQIISTESVQHSVSHSDHIVSIQTSLYTFRLHCKHSDHIVSIQTTL